LTRKIIAKRPFWRSTCLGTKEYRTHTQLAIRSIRRTVRLARHQCGEDARQSCRQGSWTQVSANAIVYSSAGARPHGVPIDLRDYARAMRRSTAGGLGVASDCHGMHAEDAGGLADFEFALGDEGHDSVAAAAAILGDGFDGCEVAGSFGADGVAVAAGHQFGLSRAMPASAISAASASPSDFFNANMLACSGQRAIACARAAAFAPSRPVCQHWHLVN